MKATLWLWTLIAIATLLCTQCIAAPHYGDSRYLRENFISPKRTKPSLSIVNPLDVLRQRIMLEMARRQMRENTKQVEMNKAILKTIGKRGNQQNGELNNEYDLDYSILDDYYPHARFYYETPFQHYQHPRDPTTSLLNNIFNLNNNVLSNKHQLKSVHSNKETSPLLTVDDKNPEALASSDTSSDHGTNNNNNNQGSEQVKSDNKNSNLDQLDDVKNNVDDNELQLKYLYSLYRNRFDNF